MTSAHLVGTTRGEPRWGGFRPDKHRRPLGGTLLSALNLVGAEVFLVTDETIFTALGQPGKSMQACYAEQAMVSG
jgi:hypothetical protein